MCFVNCLFCASDQDCLITSKLLVNRYPANHQWMNGKPVRTLPVCEKKDWVVGWFREPFTHYPCVCSSLGWGGYRREKTPLVVQAAARLVKTMFAIWQHLIRIQ